MSAEKASYHHDHEAERGRTVTTEIKTILAELREDHRNMSILLDLVEAQMLKVDAGEEPDLELLRDIMQYMTTYSDTIHHPKEDLVYAEMKDAGGDIAEGLEHVEEDHVEIAKFGKSLRDDIDAMPAGTAVTRDHVLHDMIDYVHGLRKHMAWEEGDLFMRADAMIDKESKTVDLGHLEVSDPVFGATSEAAFENLLHHLQIAAGR